MKYVHFESGTSLQKLMGDVVDSKNWYQVFGNSVVKDKNCDDTHFLDILSQEYKACKDKQVTKKINQNAKKQKEKFLIGNTKSQSRLTLEGKMLDNVKSRTDAARKIGQVRHYGDEKRRLLSIVATDFPHRTLQQLFGCSPNSHRCQSSLETLSKHLRQLGGGGDGRAGVGLRSPPLGAKLEY